MTNTQDYVRSVEITKQPIDATSTPARGVLVVGEHTATENNQDLKPEPESVDSVHLDVQADAGNSGNVLVGTDAERPIVLGAGQSFSVLARFDISTLFFEIEDEGDRVAWIYLEREAD